MKKTIGILALIISTGAFAQNNDYNNTGDKQTEGRKHKMSMQQEIEKLTPEQQEELRTMQEKNMKENMKIMLSIKEVDIQIKKEMLNEKLNTKKIEQLIDQKSKLHATQEKSMLKFMLEVKSKFGIELMMGQHRMGENREDMPVRKG
ncbi:Spy/CpxP family protein refolding chaperone [Ilyobacter sp.]|uniref:Spy/CpxP family protein refolding chaperone n=1 Tax=Ilyobacter sp. TaxID=3100343 RepID=UPI003567A663